MGPSKALSLSSAGQKFRSHATRWDLKPQWDPTKGLRLKLDAQIYSQVWIWMLEILRGKYVPNMIPTSSSKLFQINPPQKDDIPKIPAKKSPPKHPQNPRHHPSSPSTFCVRSMLERFEKRFESQEVGFDVVLVLGGTNDVLQNVPWRWWRWNRKRGGFFSCNQIVNIVTCHSYAKGEHLKTSASFPPNFWSFEMHVLGLPLPMLEYKSHIGINVPAFKTCCTGTFGNDFGQFAGMDLEPKARFKSDI